LIDALLDRDPVCGIGYRTSDRDLAFMFTYPFEKLEAWQAARRLSAQVYSLTTQFPSEEKYGIVQQIRRAAISVASNLSEGTGRYSAKDQGHFYSMAYSSLMELLNQLIISNDLNYLTAKDYENIRSLIEPLSAIITGLRKHTLNKQP
jgi:four helix bundle protein